MPNDLQPCCADEEHQNHAERFTANAVGKRVEKRIGGPSDGQNKTNPEDSASRSDYIKRGKAKRGVLQNKQ